MKKKSFYYMICTFILAGSIAGCSHRDKEQAQTTVSPEATRSAETLDPGVAVDESTDGTGSSIETQESEVSTEQPLTEAPADQLLTEDAGILSSVEDIDLHDKDGGGQNYVFTYDNKEYTAKYTEDHWKIINSYKIKETSDMTIICQGLIDLHPIHGKDMESYRTAEDMAFEWLQHNMVYEQLPDDSPWKENVKDVDLDPADQGKTFKELYEDRTGKKFRLKDFITVQ